MTPPGRTSPNARSTNQCAIFSGSAQAAHAYATGAVVRTSNEIDRVPGAGARDALASVLAGTVGWVLSAASVDGDGGVRFGIGISVVRWWRWWRWWRRWGRCRT